MIVCNYSKTKLFEDYLNEGKKSAKINSELLDTRIKDLQKGIDLASLKKSESLSQLLTLDEKDMSNRQKLKLYSIAKKKAREFLELDAFINGKDLDKSYKKDPLKVYSLVFGKENGFKLAQQLLEAYIDDIKSEYNDVIGYIQELQNEQEKQPNDKSILLVVDKDDFFKEYESVKEMATKMLKSRYNLELCIHNPMVKTDHKARANYLYGEDEFEKIIDLNNYLKSHGMTKSIFFDEKNGIFTLDNEDKSAFSQKHWSLEEVIKANKEIDKVVEFIKKNNFSPYEAMIYIHMYITSNFSYCKSYSLYREEQAVIVGAYNREKIVCSGFSSLTKAIIDKLNFSGLSCEFLSGDLYNKNSKKYIGSHSQALIHIQDEKYKIKGNYVNDACWDSKKENYEILKDGYGFALCMFPISDLMHLKKFFYSQIKAENRFEDLFYERERIFEKLRKRLGSKNSKLLIKKSEISESISIGSTLVALDYVLRCCDEKYLNKSIRIGKIREIIGKSQVHALAIFDSTASNEFINVKDKIDKLNVKNQNDLSK